MLSTAKITTLIALAVGIACASCVLAEAPGDPRGAVIEAVHNDHPAFMVRVQVDHPDQSYFGGDQMQVSVRSARAGYLYLLYCNADREVSCLFPNTIQTDNRIAAEREVTIPSQDRFGRPEFKITMGKPYGKEILKAIVTTEPLKSGALTAMMKALHDADPARARGALIEEVKSLDWAEHHVQIVTQARAAAAPREPKRFGLFIGISDFADPSIRDLKVSHADAAAFARAMKEAGGVQQGWLLTNEQATRVNIERALRQVIPAATRPGDAVIIYWSGHGSRCADDGGDEKDGFDEYLVPHDGRLDDIDAIRNTMVLDDTFGRWLQELDGRRVLVVLDTCHSGGQGQEKSIKLEPQSDEEEAAPFDFLDGEFAQMKDIGQRETALLASSTAAQVSFERREGDLSTMTYFLIEQMRAAEGPLELTAAHQLLKDEVARYVEETFPGTTQSPVLVNYLSQPFYLRTGDR